MARQILITAGSVERIAELNASRTADAIWEALPLEGQINRWGDEIYFPIRLRLGTERGQATVSLGDIAYWEFGTGFCIFFGPTPASYGNEIRAYSPVTVIGRIIEDPSGFSTTNQGEPIAIHRVAD